MYIFLLTVTIHFKYMFIFFLSSLVDIVGYDLMWLNKKERADYW